MMFSKNMLIQSVDLLFCSSIERYFLPVNGVLLFIDFVYNILNLFITVKTVLFFHILSLYICMCNIYVYNVYVNSPYILYIKYKYRFNRSKYNYLVLLVLHTVKSNNIIYRNGIFFFTVSYCR